MDVNSASHRLIADLLEARTGQRMSESRRWRIATALSGVFRERGISNVDQLACLLADAGSEALSQEVVEALLNNETYFFRDRIMFELLGTRVLPDLARKRAATKRLSIWSAGCSTGQEALSIAMLFVDQPSLWQGWQIDIVGTDISTSAIEAARRACYSQFEIQRGLGVSQMLTHFRETKHGWEANPAIRRMVRFKVRNLLEPAQTLQRHDLVLCRNVLLYFDEHRRTQAFQRIDEALADDGWLMLGAGETVVGRTRAFRAAEGNQGLYIRNREPFDGARTDTADRLRARAR